MVFGSRVLWNSVKEAAPDLSKKPTFLIVTSVNNPTEVYGGTRHNAGEYALQCTQLNFVRHPRLLHMNYALDMERKNILYLTGNSYMNLSGTPIQAAWAYFTNLKKNKYNVKYLVVHDELSLPVGKIQLRRGSQSIRGHNGLKSVKEKCQVDFFRLGIGIGRPESRIPHDVAEYVLSIMPRDDRLTIAFEAVPKMMKVIDELRNTAFPENTDLVLQSAKNKKDVQESYFDEENNFIDQH